MQNNEKKARQEFKDYQKDMEIEFIGLLEHLTGKKKFVSNSVKIQWSSESVQSLIDQLPQGKERAEIMYRRIWLGKRQ